MKAWGRYQLVDSPADADLVYEIGFAAPIVHNGVPTTYEPQFNLSIVDTRTHFRLWTLLTPVHGAIGRLKDRQESCRWNDKSDGGFEKAVGWGRCAARRVSRRYCSGRLPLRGPPPLTCGHFHLQEFSGPAAHVVAHDKQ